MLRVPLLAQSLVVVGVVLAARSSSPTRVPSHLSRTTWDSVYSSAQAQRGQATYSSTCSRCHQPGLGGADEAPPLAGGAFLSSWDGQSLGELHLRVRTTMPSDNAGVYTRQQVSDVIAYMLQYNGFPAGTAELPVDATSLEDIRITAMPR